MLTYSQRKTAAQRGAASMNATVAAAVAAVKAERDAQMAEAKAESVRRNQPIPFTDEEWRAAVVVRTKLGWHKVIRVNTKSVTVATGYSWTDRVSRDSVIEVKGTK